MSGAGNASAKAFQSPREHVSLCVQCQRLFSSFRRHKLFCSGACRVAAHRHPEFVEIAREAAEFASIEVWMGQQEMARRKLRDLGYEIPRAAGIERDEATLVAFERLIVRQVLAEAADGEAIASRPDTESRQLSSEQDELTDALKAAFQAFHDSARRRAFEREKRQAARQVRDQEEASHGR